MKNSILFSAVRAMIVLLAGCALLSVFMLPSRLTVNAAGENSRKTLPKPAVKTKIYFEENRGQIDERVRFISRGADGAAASPPVDNFYPSAQNQVNSVVLQPDGKVLVGGRFNGFFPNGGAFVPRLFIARLNADGTPDNTFMAAANQVVYAIALQPDGKVVIGGDFTSVSSNGGPQFARSYIARFNADGTVDQLFNPSMCCSVFAIAVQPDGQILAGGNNSAVDRLDAVTGAVNFSFIGNNQITSIVFQPDGKILIGGYFSTIGGANRSYVARFFLTGIPDLSFNANANLFVTALLVQPDGRILVTGDFTQIGGQPRFRAARLDANGNADSFSINPDNRTYSLGLQSDGKFLVGGGFLNLGATPRKGLARFNADGTLDTSFDAQIDGTPGVISIVEQPDRKLLVGGDFQTLNGIERQNIARLGLAPSAARVSVSGRISAMLGGGIGKVRVSLTDSSGNVRTASTNAFGFYNFDEVPAGQTYVVSVNHKKYVFSPDSQILNVSEDLSGIDFTANE